MNAMVLLSVTSAFFMGTNQEVVQSFNNRCDRFFFQNTEPSGFGNNYRRICQRYKNQYRFATLYDQNNRVPVYSSYIYQDNTSGNRSDIWKLEPQLANWPPSVKVSQLVDMMGTNINQRIQVSQAVKTDYETGKPKFDKGHLNPVCHQNGIDNRAATFTLTNAAPMPHGFNQRWFNQYEDVIRKCITQQCKQKMAYIVTGTVPGNQYMNNRVLIPSYVWSAVCCTLNNGSYVSVAVYERNVPQPSPLPPIQFRQVAELNKILSRYFKTPISIFRPPCP
uniref:Uncharacterized protein n=1 Tax=Latimeria chalumnae TaxID=7897 RepID=H3A286_LATCH